MIENGQTYRLNHLSPYMFKKYGVARPEITIIGEDVQVLGKSWQELDNNYAAILFRIRCKEEAISLVRHAFSTVFYGKIGDKGELVHISELESLEPDRQEEE